MTVDEARRVFDWFESAQREVRLGHTVAYPSWLSPLVEEFGVKQTAEEPSKTAYIKLRGGTEIELPA